MATALTRYRDEVFLIGIRDLEPLSRLNQLPTVRQTLLRFHKFLQEKKSVRNAAHLVIDEVRALWNKSSIPTQQPKHCIEKFEKIHASWLLLKKNKGRSSQSQRQREQLFTSNLDKLFDIAHAESDQLIKISADREFLIDQRGERKMIMTSVDIKLQKKQERVLQRKRRAEYLRQKTTECSETTAFASTSTSIAPNQLSDLNSDSCVSDEDTDEDDEFKLLERKKTQVLLPAVNK